jgi:ubiquinone biosynthesis protein
VFPTVTLAQRLRLALEELGPTYIKLGQVLSTRPDLVPREIIAELKKLQFSVHFVPTDVIRHIIESELGRPISEIFDSFDDTPLAAASLAQVHRAVLKGKQVVLKVQRPNVTEITELDVEILRSLANLAERYSPTLYLINPVGFVDEFALQIRKELDFHVEAHNMAIFKQNFAGDRTIHVPEVYHELCTRHVVTMEYLDGIKISDIQGLRNGGYDLQLVARRGAILGYKAIFECGFFHADPHPGNIFVMPDNIIGLIDFGMMATLSTRDRDRLAKLVYFISEHDDKRVARALNELMEAEDIIPAEDLESSMSSLIQEYADLPTKESRVAEMLFAMMRAIMAHGARLRPQLLWITKTIAVQEDVASSLGADFNLMDLGKPHARKILWQKINPVRRPRELYYWLLDAIDMARDLPYDAGIILREIRKGRIKIEFEHRGLEPVRKTMEEMANRSALTNIIVALLISSSVIVLAKLPPLVGSIPALGLAGYIIALILAIILTISITTHRHR